MSAPILATKLYIPISPPKVVLRPRLIERLNVSLCQEQGFGQKLTLISAPAGFGKTTLLSEWIPGCQRLVAWLSLDEGDNDLNRFLVYLVAALQTIVPNIGEEVIGVLQTPQPPSTESILTTLLNQITAIPNDFIFILDDYHVIDSPAVDNALTFLIEHLPQQMHLVITTREDPALPIPRLRARGQLTELRAADLRFTSAEAAEFLNRVMGLNLSQEDIGALDTRTEGWIAGLQLAALSMKGHQDIPGFIRAFAGDHRYIVEYLVEEVLKRQPESIRSFLIQTAILDRLNGPLCEAVTGLQGGSARLETLQRGNFFIIPLDDRRYWYRYHHLFGDVLRMHLMTEQPDQVSVLHRRASEWFEQHEAPADAVRHALAAQDFAHAADLIERALPGMRQTRQESAMLAWLKALPDEVYQNRPVLSVNYAGTLLQNGQIDGVESHLRDAERWLAAPEDIREQLVYVDEEDFQRLPGLVAMYHAAIALIHGDVANTIHHARKVLELAREDDDFPRGAGLSLLGLAFWTSGDLETAYEMFSKGMAQLQRVGFISDVIGGSVTLADIRITQGRLREAMSIYERGLQLATKQGTPALRGAADMHVGMSGLCFERNELNIAEQHLLKSKELGELNGLPKNPYRWRVAMAQIRGTRGDLEGALDLLDEAENNYMGDFSPNVHPISALKARVSVRQGELEKALDWARQRKLSIEEAPSYLREFEQIAFARILLAQFQCGNSVSLLQNAMESLERLLRAADEGGRIGSVIEILILQTLAYQMHKDIPAALTSLERALKLAEPEGYMQIFLAEGSGLAELIREVGARGILPDYTRKLLSAFEAEKKGLGQETPPFTAPASSSIIEPLSQRELDILRLFKTELSGPEIAQELVIALSTVRTHTKSIYGKLNVNSRRGAVSRAIQLGLLKD
jgi:LuxR family maltose regulon positive regulatory protein